jgi:hypothetical protein
MGLIGQRRAIPLDLVGNVSDRQKMILEHLLKEVLGSAMERVVETVDQQAAQYIIESDARLKAELVEFAVKTIQHYAISDKFKDEAVGSERVYPSNYRVKSIEAQVTELKALFPVLKSCDEKLPLRYKLPEGAEGWFAIPRWQALGATYNEALERIIEAFSTKRRFSNRIVHRMGAQYLHMTERTALAQQVLCEQQKNNDILVVAAQTGMLHRGASARRTRIELARNEYSLGTFAIAALLITHPERLSNTNTLMIDCSGDEYSAGGGDNFDRVPLFDFDIGGVEFSIFYYDRARNLWGSPTGFIFKVE